VSDRSSLAATFTSARQCTSVVAVVPPHMPAFLLVGSTARKKAPCPPTPVSLYFAELSPGSRRTIAQGLRHACRFWGGGDPDTFLWHRLRVEQMVALRGRPRHTPGPEHRQQSWQRSRASGGPRGRSCGPYTGLTRPRAGPGRRRRGGGRAPPAHRVPAAARARPLV
jgi:hypothetical protein